MKLIIAGPRDFEPDLQDITEAVSTFTSSHFKPKEIVHGGCRGVDLKADKWAAWMGIPRTEVLAEWDKHGRAAGPLRNREMAEYADGLLVIRNRVSRGTNSMIKEARRAKIPVVILDVNS